MEFKYVIKNKQKSELFDLKKKYKKALRNSLGIKNVTNDKAIFCTKDSKMLDCLEILSEENINLVMNEKKFKIQINKIDIDLEGKIKKCKTIEEVSKVLNNSDLKITKTLIALMEKDFKKGQKEVLEWTLKKTFDQTLKWKRLIKEISDSYDTLGIWPFYLGTCLIKIKTPTNYFYAPLILKAVEIIVEQNVVYLKSREEGLVFNDKIYNLYNESVKEKLPEIINIDSVNLKSVVKEIKEYFKNEYSINFENEITVFEEVGMSDINEKMEIKNNLILIQCQPTGGNLRKAMLEVMKNGKIEEILYVKDQLFNYEKDSIEEIVLKDKRIARVCQTDPSQEKAIIAALKNSSIILGPPGTGKSQTIANILANILLNNERALFISQKKSALEIVLERVGSLRCFFLEMIEGKNLNTDLSNTDFYKDLKKLMKKIRNMEETEIEDIGEFSSLISKEFIQSIKNKKEFNKIKKENLEYFLTFLKDLNIEIKFEKKDLIESFEIFDKIKQIGQQKQLKHLIDNFDEDINIFAKNIEVKSKKTIFGNSYDKNFKIIFNVVKKMNTFIKKYKIENCDYLSLFKIDSIDEILLLSKMLKEFQQIPHPLKQFNSDEDKIFKLATKRTKDNFYRLQKNKIKTDSNWIRKFEGQIEHAQLLPSSFTNKYKNELKEIFNIFVGTPELLANFVDFNKEKYDYVIFDEASQMFLEKSLPFMAIANKVIVAGDNQQMQPSNWFQKRFDDDGEEIEDIDSLLTYIVANGLPKHTLEMNYRSKKSSLIAFSANEFYEDNLKGLDYNSEKTKEKTIEVINVKGTWEKGCNSLEVEKTVEMLKKNIKKYNKIIVLTLNKTQIEHIEEYIAVKEPAIYEEILNNRIVLKNLENIQGDEADLVILSIAYDKNTNIGSTYIGRSGGRNSLNVALSRAKEKMIIIKSIDSVDVKGCLNDDIMTFKKWLNFLELEETQKTQYSKNEFNESKVEVIDSIYNELKEVDFLKKYEIEKNVDVGSYVIDIGIMKNGKMILGIEIDKMIVEDVKNIYQTTLKNGFLKSKNYNIISIHDFVWTKQKANILKEIEREIEKG
ncbi:MAG: AAA domain-containing protein [Mycoplasma sp.]